MTLPSTGPLSASQINVELGRASNAALSLGGSAERGLAGVASGAISFANLRGKANFTASIPTSASKTANTATISSDPVACTTIGGSGGNLYQWSVSNQSGNLTVQIQSPTASTAVFRVLGAVSGDDGECDAICTVTDSTGHVAISNVCHILLTRS